MKLLQNVTSTVHQVCRRLKMEEYKSNASILNQRIKPGRLTPNSVHAVKNGRRKMEDRHVVIHDLNMIYSDTNTDVSKLLSYIINQSSNNTNKCLTLKCSR